LAKNYKECYVGGTLLQPSKVVKFIFTTLPDHGVFLQTFLRQIIKMEKLAIFGGNPVVTELFPAFPAFDKSDENALIEVLHSGIWGGYNPKVGEFERAFADFHGSRFGITAANGTVTLETALAAAGIGQGDEVIVPPVSFIATATAVLRVGATPVFVDIDGPTCNIAPSGIRAAITGKTRAVIPVHFAGQPADMDEIMETAREHDLVVIEDCAHAHGAAWRGKKIGSFGDFGSFSFQASKNLTAGEGGFLTCNDDELAEKARSICNQGRRTGGAWYEHVRLGTNLRITGWQAAILLTQFARLPEQIKTREGNAAVLNERLKDIDLISLAHVDERVTQHSHYLYLIRLNLERSPGLTKERFVEALAAEGVPCSVGYPQPLYKNQVFKEGNHITNDCPEAERMCKDTFWLSHEVMLSMPAQASSAAAAIAKVADSVDALTDRKALGI
jgi:dTDP-4-amino-4,6-dideoxygalactose transaminase